MKKLFSLGAFAALALLGAQAQAVVNPIHLWTFNDGTAKDSVGTMNGTLFGNATISNGQLILPGTTDGNGIRSYMGTGTENITLTAMTLVAWVSLGTLNQSGGTALSVVNNAQQFDGIDYGEATARQWMNGSDYGNRSAANNGGALATDTAEHMMAITYSASGTVTMYKDGVQYGNVFTYAPFTFTDEHYLVGLRHDAGGNAMLTGAVDTAAIYAQALSASDVATLYAAGPNGSAVPEPATWGMMLLGFGAIGAALRRKPRSGLVEA